MFTTCQGISDSINVWEMGHQKRDGSSDGDVEFEIAEGCVGESGCARRGGSFEMWKCGDVKVGAFRAFRGKRGCALSWKECPWKARSTFTRLGMLHPRERGTARL